MNTAFQNPWWENDATSNMSFFWWAADDSKVCIHVMLPTEGPELDIILLSRCCYARMQISVSFSTEVD